MLHLINKNVITPGSVDVADFQNKMFFIGISILTGW
jgi:hypothetical protein